MGDGGFWHNGLLTGVQSALFNHDDAVLLIFKNGYSSATGTQNLISTPDAASREMADAGMQSLTHTNTRSNPPCRAWACSGCAPCTPTTWTRCAPR